MARIRNEAQVDFLGGGTAGLVAAKTAASLKARVMLVERDRPGGDCLWIGCVPSKALIAAASAAARIERSPSLGTYAGETHTDFTTVMDHVRAAIRTIEPTDSFDALRAAGVQVMAGDAVFVAERTARVRGSAIRFRQALVATGATPTMPNIPGLAEIDALTSETIWNLDHLPRRMAIIGGGPIACELGQAFARLGAEVRIVTRDERLLSHEDSDAVRIVTMSMRADGVHMHVGATVTGVAATHAGAAGPAHSDWRMATCCPSTPC